jgi:hypothetical protein
MNMWNLYDKSPPVEVGTDSGSTNVTARPVDLIDVVVPDHDDVTSKIDLLHGVTRTPRRAP